MVLRRSMSVRPSVSEAFELHRADLRAVLFLLAAPLRLLVVMEFALDAVDGAMEEVDRRPQQVLEVGFETRVVQRRYEDEDICDSAADCLGFGQRFRVR